MQKYSEFRYTGDNNSHMCSTFLSQPDGATYDDAEQKLYWSNFATAAPPRLFIKPPKSAIVPSPIPPVVVDYMHNHLQVYAPFQDVIKKRNWYRANLGLTAKDAEVLCKENVNLQMANTELKMKLFHLQQQQQGAASYGKENMFPIVNGNYVVDSCKRMRTREKGMNVSGVENVDPIKKSDQERVKLPKSISVLSNGYLKTVQTGDGSTVGASVVDRAITASDMQRIHVCGKKEEQPLGLLVFNQGMIKTEVCNKWQQTGDCPYGNHCRFAHGIEELRPVIRHPRYKTQVCRTVLAGDSCQFGPRCHFRHALTEEEKLMSRSLNS